MRTGSSSDETFVSTGQLPTPETVNRLVEEAYQQFRFNTDGKNSDVYPALERVLSDLFGICVVGTNGNVFGAGAIDHEFAIMSVSKPFVFGWSARNSARNTFAKGSAPTPPDCRSTRLAQSKEAPPDAPIRW